MKRLFYKEFASTTECVCDTIREAIATLARHGWCEPERDFCVRLCIEEALTNAVVHGNECESCLTVCIEILEDGEKCLIRVSDQGQGFDPEAMTMPDCEEMGGRGICLIKHYMDEVRFDSEKRCLEMEFTRDSFPCKT